MLTPPVELLIVKLHASSEYTFLLEIYDKQSEFKDLITSNLAFNSKDAVFPGYPYGLILVDRFARVSNEERDYFLTKMEIKAGKSWNSLKK